ncbi:MAG: cellulase [Gammaproteobacteria bacterium]|jgi:endoglucanase|nr:cellulase [Gammaproteobacteria bacterium]
MKTLIKTILLLTTSLSINALADTPSAWPKQLSYYDSMPFRGVNLSGAEFAPTAKPADQITLIPTIEDGVPFAFAGMNTFRVPFAWEYLQPDLNGDFDLSYSTALYNTIDSLLNQGAFVIVDMHDYMRYTKGDPSTNPQGSNQNIIGTPGNASTTSYANAWAEIAKHFNNNPNTKNVIFDLMNEPHDMDSQLALQNENAAIQAIRAIEGNGYHHLILIEGNAYSGMHSWNSSGNAQVFNSTNIQDSANNYAINVHQYFDQNFSGSEYADCLPTDQLEQQLNLPDFVNFLNSNKLNAMVTEFGSKDSPTCRADMARLLMDLQQNAADGTRQGFIGWTAWSAGHAWGNYQLNLSYGGPAQGLMDNILSQFITKAGNLPYGLRIASLKNNSNYTLQYSSSVGGFQTYTTGNIAPGQTAYIYTLSNGTWQKQQTQITYQITDQSGSTTYFGFGLNNQGYGFFYPATAFDGLILKKSSSCSLDKQIGYDSPCYEVDSN